MVRENERSRRPQMVVPKDRDAINGLTSSNARKLEEAGVWGVGSEARGIFVLRPCSVCGCCPACVVRKS